LDHYGVAFMAAWVANLNVGLDLTPNLIALMSHIGPND
jgi:hypothetical protein